VILLSTSLRAPPPRPLPFLSTRGKLPEEAVFPLNRGRSLATVPHSLFLLVFLLHVLRIHSQGWESPALAGGVVIRGGGGGRRLFSLDECQASGNRVLRWKRGGGCGGCGCRNGGVAGVLWWS